MNKRCKCHENIKKKGDGSFWKVSLKNNKTKGWVGLTRPRWGWQERGGPAAAKVLWPGELIPLEELKQAGVSGARRREEGKEEWQAEAGAMVGVLWSSF